MNSYNTEDVFTPTRPARATFVERQSINERVVDAIRTPGMQIIVYGATGSGKTTLLTNKLDQLYSCHIVTRCTEMTRYESLILDAFDQMSPFYVKGMDRQQKHARKSSLSLDYLHIKTKIGAERIEQVAEKSERILPPQLTPQRLAKFMGSIGCCWVLEDFHKMEKEEKARLAQIMKVFVDSADEYPRVKIIAVGAVNSPREVIELNPEMAHRVTEILVPMMSRIEILKIMEMGEERLNISLDPRIRVAITGLSSGLASVCHQLCLNICFGMSIYETARRQIQVPFKEVDRAITGYLESSSDSLKAAFDQAVLRLTKTIYDNCKLILIALAQLPEDGGSHSEILRHVQLIEPSYPAANLTRYLHELQAPFRSEIVRFDSHSKMYAFGSPILRAYTLLRFVNDEDVVLSGREPLRIPDGTMPILLSEGVDTRD